MRDIKGDYQRAYVEEYESYRRAGRPDDAKRIAGILRDHYGHDVNGEADDEPETAKSPDTPERADKEQPPENTAEPKPTRPAAKRTTAKKPAGE